MVEIFTAVPRREWWSAGPFGQSSSGRSVGSDMWRRHVRKQESDRAAAFSRLRRDGRPRCCLEVQRPYLGPVIGTYTDWTPLTGRPGLFPENIDTSDPWQFRNVLV